LHTGDISIKIQARPVEGLVAGQAGLAAFSRAFCMAAVWTGTGLQWLYERRVKGMIILASCICDLAHSRRVPPVAESMARRDVHYGMASSRR